VTTHPGYGIWTVRPQLAGSKRSSIDSAPTAGDQWRAGGLSRCSGFSPRGERQSATYPQAKPRAPILRQAES
jgi:hypothetical protein